MIKTIDDIRAFLKKYANSDLTKAARIKKNKKEVD